MRMHRLFVAAAAGVAALAVAPAAPAAAEPGLSCEVTVCVAATIEGRPEGCGAPDANGYRTCRFSVDWSASATAVTPGGLEYGVSAPGWGHAGGCRWIHGGCAASGSKSLSKLVRCGTTTSVYVYFWAEASSTLETAYVGVGASVTLVSDAC